MCFAGWFGDVKFRSLVDTAQFHGDGRFRLNQCVRCSARVFGCCGGFDRIHPSSLCGTRVAVVASVNEDDKASRAKEIWPPTYCGSPLTVLRFVPQSVRPQKCSLLVWARGLSAVSVFLCALSRVLFQAHAGFSPRRVPRHTRSSSLRTMQNLPFVAQDAAASSWIKRGQRPLHLSATCLHRHTLRAGWSVSRLDGLIRFTVRSVARVARYKAWSSGSARQDPGALLKG